MDDLDLSAQLQRHERWLIALTRLVTGAVDMAIVAGVYILLTAYEKLHVLLSLFIALGAGYLAGFCCRRYIEAIRNRR